MKTICLISVCILLFFTGDSKKQFSDHIETRADFWKAHAYVELKLLDLKIEKIIKNENNTH